MVCQFFTVGVYLDLNIEVGSGVFDLPFESYNDAYDALTVMSPSYCLVTATVLLVPNPALSHSRILNLGEEGGR